MQQKFEKVKTVHHMLDEFKKFLSVVEKQSNIMKIIPARISRQQKWSSEQRFKVSYDTQSGIKCIMSKWATAQEVFVICAPEHKNEIRLFLLATGRRFWFNK